MKPEIRSAEVSWFIERGLPGPEPARCWITVPLDEHWAAHCRIELQHRQPIIGEIRVGAMTQLPSGGLRRQTLEHLKPILEDEDLRRRAAKELDRRAAEIREQLAQKHETALGDRDSDALKRIGAYLRNLPKRPARERTPDAFLAKVATLYVEAHKLDPKHVDELLAQKLSESGHQEATPALAAKWVLEARSRNLLSAGRGSGFTGGELTDQAQDVFDPATGADAPPESERWRAGLILGRSM